MKKFIILISLVASLFSCQDFDQLRKDPNRVSDVPYYTLLTQTLYDGVANTLLFNREVNNELMQYSVYLYGEQGIHRWWFNSNTAQSQWVTLYRMIENQTRMNELAKAADDKNYQAVARTLRAYNFYLLTMLFGDIPCIQACNHEQYLQPEFDPQSEVFKYITKELDTANMLYDTSKKLVGQDIMYNQNTLKWKKFTNSLQLRVQLTLLQKEEVRATAVEKMVTILNDPTRYPIFESNDDNANLYYTGIEPNFNPRFQDLDNVYSSRRTSLFFINGLKLVNDPRAAKWLQGTLKDGIPSGFAPSQQGYGDYSTRPLYTMKTSQYNGIMMQFAEVEFIKAELIFLGFWPGRSASDRDQYYKSGIIASCQYWGVTEDLINTLLRNSNIATFTQSRLYLQKYYALMFVGAQQWFEFRRTGKLESVSGATTYKVGVPPTGAIMNASEFPKRCLYPLIAQTTNRTHYKEAIHRQGLDDVVTRTWVEVRPVVED